MKKICLIVCLSLSVAAFSGVLLAGAGDAWAKRHKGTAAEAKGPVVKRLIPRIGPASFLAISTKDQRRFGNLGFGETSSSGFRLSPPRSLSCRNGSGGLGAFISR